MTRSKESLLAATTPVNVRELLQSDGPFGFEQARQLERAIARSQYAEVRLEFQSIEEKVLTGDKSTKLRAKVGVTHYVLGQHSRAHEMLSALDKDAVAQFFDGQTLLGLERYAEAAEQFEAAEKGGADAVDCRLSRAGAVRAMGRLDEAEKLVQSSASMGGATKAEYSYQMGCILSDRGDTYGAVEYFERAVDMDPYHSKALFSLAGENMLRGNDEEAVRLYERSLSRPPLHLGAMMNLGLLYEDLENYPAAAYCFKRVLESNPAHARARLYLKDIDAAQGMYYDEESLRNQARIGQLLEIPVTDFELSVRARNCLQKMGIRNLGDLTKITEQELLGSKNFGDTSLNEIKLMLESKGLSLGQALHTTKDKSRDYYRNEALSPQEQALMGRPVADLNLSVRARKCMSRLGITTLGELCQRSQEELLESKNFGVTSLNEVRSKLTDLGLKLRGD
ncbi:MAG: polymerase alpha subunit domain protein [Planctomycetaceae bacterium]|nr:polymerase alpha subunit domain protein [Planctomycetaceae bacterium]